MLTVVALCKCMMALNNGLNSVLNVMIISLFKIFIKC